MPRVLIVDDETSQLEIMRLMFERRSCEVHTAQNIADAMTLLETTRYDFCTLDIRLDATGESGVDLLRMIRESHPDLPCVMVSGFLDPQTEIEVVRLGSRERVHKPLTLQDVQIVLHKLAQGEL